MENKLTELIGFNSINLGAISLSFMDVESILTIAVLISALVYNIKKIKSDKI
jgi:hypothetical protein|tara:strand:+ start:1434 stop:1589 length:156 start_codon:yes stop_codon:yes gene_type:complete